MMRDAVPDIPFAVPFVGAEEEAAVLRVLRSGWLTTGAEAAAFEQEFAAFLSGAAGGGSARGSGGGETGDARPGLRCFAVNSATSGLHLALEACGVGPGDVVFVPSYTFTATAEVVRYLGADPVFVDVAPGTFHIDPQALEAAVRQRRGGRKWGRGAHGARGASGAHAGRPKAVIPVHYGGLACDMSAIMDIARRHDLKVVEDAAHSFPALAGGTFAGTFGDAGVFSFYATKTITTGEGGMVVCRDEAIARRVSMMRSHGIDRTIWNRYTDTKASWYYEVVEAGYKYNLPDLLAAVGRAQLGRAWDLLAMRQAIAAEYDSAFRGDERLILPPTCPEDASRSAGRANVSHANVDARHLYPLRLNPQRLGISRDEFARKLKESGIGISVHFIPLHVMPFYKNRYGLSEDDFPETMKSYRQEISLPIWPGMSEAQIGRVIEAVRNIASA